MELNVGSRDFGGGRKDNLDLEGGRVAAGGGLPPGWNPVDKSKDDNGTLHLNMNQNSQ